MSDWNLPLTYEELHEKYYYEDGKLYYKKNNKIAGGFHKSTGYFNIEIEKRCFGVHRIIFALLTKSTPIVVDHCDGNRTNNNIDNLRSASYQQNAFNRATATNNTSGIKGVYWNKDKKKWRAHIKIDNKQEHLGYFNTLEDAKTARIDAAKKYHGEYVRHA